MIIDKLLELFINLFFDNVHYRYVRRRLIMGEVDDQVLIYVKKRHRTFKVPTTISILLGFFPSFHHCLASKMLFLVKDKEYDSTILGDRIQTFQYTKIIIGYSCHVHLSLFFVSLERKLKVILMPKTVAVKNSKATTWQQLRHFTLCHFCATAAASCSVFTVHTRLQFFFCVFTIFRHEQISATVVLLLCGYNLPFEEKKGHFFHLHFTMQYRPRKRERKFAQNDDCHSEIVLLNLFLISFHAWA